MSDITGTESGETLNGTSGSDRIDGLGGNDTIYGGDGDDTLDGGEGNDIVYGDGGNDTILVTGGTSSGTTATDSVYGGTGIDRLVVDYSLLTNSNGISMGAPYGGAEGRAGSIAVAGSTRLYFYEIEALTLTSGAGADTVYGLGNDDLIETGGGIDTIYSAAGAGRDRIDAGEGTDSVSADWSDLSDAVALDVNDAAGVTIGTGATERYLRGVERLEDFRTGSGNDSITLGAGAHAYLGDTVHTNGGDDTVTVSGGTSAGTTGLDSVFMGAGFDHLVV
ncbi:MAG: calcium-binding protein, partial [Allosphingosinicella sp.]